LGGRKQWLLSGFFLWFLVWACIPAHAAGTVGEPWSLAFVIEDSGAMNQAWLQTYPREAAEKALKLELRTLPLRINAAVWLASGRGTQVLIPPSTSLELKEVDPKLPQSATSRADLLSAVEQAAGWLEKMGGGSIIVIATSDAPPGAPTPALLKTDNIFCHVVALDPKTQGGSLATLALAGGGSHFLAAKPNRLLTMLHRAVITAFTPARLVIKAHDQTNQPVKLTYGLKRRGELATNRRGITGRVQQCLPGVYDLAWPPAAPTGPAPPPAKVRVAPTGQSELQVGGQAKIKIAALDKDGREPGWKMRVSRLSDGVVLESERRTPFELNLFAGSYLIKSLVRPLAWTVDLRAGQDQKIVVGPVGSLRVGLKGPRGKLRARYTLQDLMARRPGGTGYTNQALRLKSGTYLLTLDVPPGLNRNVTITPAQETKLELPATGGLIVKSGKPGQKVEVLDRLGKVVDTGLVDRLLPLLPGKYLVCLAQPKGREKIVSIKGGELVTIEAGELSENRPVPPMPR
jgi:hypothetical protein